MGPTKDMMPETKLVFVRSLDLPPTCDIFLGCQVYIGESYFLHLLQICFIFPVGFKIIHHYWTCLFVFSLGAKTFGAKQRGLAFGQSGSPIRLPKPVDTWEVPT